MVNKYVDQIKTEYRNRLNRVQENDDSQINFMKFNMKKFAAIMSKVGDDMSNQYKTVQDSSKMIDSATDIKIFIEQNKSANLVVSKEKFQDYNGDMSKTGLSKAQKLEQKMPHHSFIVDDNYMAAVLPSRKKA